MNAGKHTVVAKLGAREVTQDFVVAEGESASVALDTHALPGEASPRPAPDVPAATSRPLGALFWIGAGLSATGIAVGGVAGIVSVTNKGNAGAFCRDNKCPPPAYASLDAASTWATVSTIAFVAAGAGAALAAAGLVLRPSASPTSATLIVRPGGADLVGSF